MIRRLIGLLIVVSHVLAPVLGVAGVAVARDIAADVDRAANQRLAQINNEVDNIKAAVADITSTFNNIRQAVQPIIDAINGALSVIASIPTQLTIPALVIPDIQFPRLTISLPSIPEISLGSINLPLGIGRVNLPSFPGFSLPNVSIGPVSLVIPDLPAFNVSIPGLSTVINVLRDAYQYIGRLAKGLFDLTDIRRIITSVNNIGNEVQQFAGDLRQLGSKYGDTVRLIITGAAIWLALVFVLSVVTILPRGWQMMLGK
jgi:phage-related protein